MDEQHGDFDMRYHLTKTWCKSHCFACVFTAFLIAHCHHKLVPCFFPSTTEVFECFGATMRADSSRQRNYRRSVMKTHDVFRNVFRWSCAICKYRLESSVVVVSLGAKASWHCCFVIHEWDIFEDVGKPYWIWIEIVKSNFQTCVMFCFVFRSNVSVITFKTEERSQLPIPLSRPLQLYITRTKLSLLEH